MACGLFPLEKLDVVNVTVVTSLVTGKRSELDTPPSGAGFDTLTSAVPAAAMFAAGTEAFSSLPLTKLVVRRAPFQSTLAPETNPVPRKTKLNLIAPGAALVGTRGWFRK